MTTTLAPILVCRGDRQDGLALIFCCDTINSFLHLKLPLIPLHSSLVLCMGMSMGPWEIAALVIGLVSCGAACVVRGCHLRKRKQNPEIINFTQPSQDGWESGNLLRYRTEPPAPIIA